ncbi:MAG: hypothetical protein JST00_20425 [Deltaproteobacteria bacterium]|nr:hypothetical protein [Deltaproteobacteria bacterium]
MGSDDEDDFLDRAAHLADDALAHFKAGRFREAASLSFARRRLALRQPDSPATREVAQDALRRAGDALAFTGQPLLARRVFLSLLEEAGTEMTSHGVAALSGLFGVELILAELREREGCVRAARAAFLRAARLGRRLRRIAVETGVVDVKAIETSIEIVLGRYHALEGKTGR